MTSFFLKVVAIITMTMDHFSSVIGQTGLLKLFPGASISATADICKFMTSIGRMAFPLFAFMIAEGCHKTTDLKKYVGRLTVFALFSEPFFYFAHHYKEPEGFAGFWKHVMGLNLENVFFTLAISAAAIACYQFLKERNPQRARFFFLPILLLAGYIAEYLNTDYSMLGVLLILPLYAACTRKAQVFIVIVWSICVYGMGSFLATSFDSPQLQYALCLTAGALLSCPFIWFYNGQRGRKTKWLFYLYYPAHFLVLSLFGLFLFR